VILETVAVGTAGERTTGTLYDRDNEVTIIVEGYGTGDNVNLTSVYDHFGNVTQSWDARGTRTDTTTEISATR
jgi:hypothetical protein